MRVLPALALCLLASQDRDPFEETEPDPQYHIRVARLYSGREETAADALYHWERAWEAAGPLPGRERADILGAMHGLHARVPHNTDPRRVNHWKILGVVFRGAAWKEEAGPRSARYKLDAKLIKAVNDGFLKSIDRLERAGRGHFKIKGDFHAVSDDVRKLRFEDDGFWMHPEEYILHKTPRWKRGDYDLVVVYIVNGVEAANSIPFGGRDVRYEADVEGAAYLNYLWTPEYALQNGENGGREVVGMVWRIRDALRSFGGYPDEILPDLDNDGMRGDRDFTASDDRRTLDHFACHIAEDHITSRMWLEAVGRPPSAPFLREWLLSPRHPINDKGLDEAPLDESNANPDARTWSFWKSNEDRIDLNARFRPQDRNSLCYALTYLYARKAAWARLYVGCNDGIKVFLNGKPVFVNRGDLNPDAGVARLGLQEGRNSLVIKTYNDEGMWDFHARLTDMRGEALKSVIVSVGKK